MCKLDLDSMLAEIRKADPRQIDFLLEAVLERKRALYPTWDICYLALPENDWEERKRILEQMLWLEQCARNQKEGSPEQSKEHWNVKYN